MSTSAHDGEIDGGVDGARTLHRVEKVMGMAVSFTVADAVPPALLDPVCDWLHWVEATFSTFQPTSEICRIHDGSLDPTNAHPLVRDVLDLCDDLYVRSDGVFDAYARGFLDPAGVVKGWSIERAAMMLEARGASNFTINAGGDIAIRGERAPGLPWTTGVRHPDPQHSHEIVKAFRHDRTPMAVATSGAYERGDHVVDGRSDAQGPPRACRSATVVGPDLTFADAYATVVFILGIDGIEWVQRQPGSYGVYVITGEGRGVSGSSLADHVTVL